MVIKMSKLGLIKCILFCLVLFSIIIGIPLLLINYTDSGREYITSTITSKYSEDYNVVIPYGIVHGTNYYLILANGDKVSISGSDYNNLKVGDSYSYWRWKK